MSKPDKASKQPARVFRSFAGEDEAIGVAVRELLLKELNLDAAAVFMWSEQAQPRAGRPIAVH